MAAKAKRGRLPLGLPRIARPRAATTYAAMRKPAERRVPASQPACADTDPPLDAPSGK